MLWRDDLQAFPDCFASTLSYLVVDLSSPVPSDLSLSTKLSTSLDLLPNFIAFPVPAVLKQNKDNTHWLSNISNSSALSEPFISWGELLTFKKKLKKKERQQCTKNCKSPRGI